MTMKVLIWVSRLVLWITFLWFQYLVYSAMLATHVYITSLTLIYHRPVNAAVVVYFFYTRRGSAAPHIHPNLIHSGTKTRLSFVARENIAGEHTAKLLLSTSVPW